MNPHASELSRNQVPQQSAPDAAAKIVRVQQKSDVVYPSQFGISKEEMDKETELMRPHRAEIKQLTAELYALQEQQPAELRSGIHIRFGEKSGYFAMVPWTASETELSEAELESVKQEQGVDGEAAEQIAAMKKLKKDIGGVGITSRNIEDVNRMFTSEFPALLAWADKITVIGNGLSILPLEIKQTHPDKTVVGGDLLNYRLVLRDLNMFIQMWQRQFPQLPLPSYITKTKEVVTQLLDNEQLLDQFTVAQPYRFSSANSAEGIPTELLDTNLALNIMGPPLTTLHQQLAMLEPGNGVLLSVFEVNENDVPDGWRVIRLARHKDGVQQLTKNVLFVPQEIINPALATLVQRIETENGERPD